MFTKKRIFAFVLVFCMILPIVVMADNWQCPSCNNDASGNFCSNCGAAYVSVVNTIELTQSTAEGDLYPVHLVYECAENLIFSTYDVDLFVDGEKIGTLEHGAEETYVLNLPKGNHTLMVTEKGDLSVCGELTLNVTGSLKVTLFMSCYNDHLSFKQESVEVLPYLTPAEAAVKEALEELMPHAIARKAVVVAMTNCYATDVFSKDGSTYSTEKFHSYDDIAGYYLSVINEGDWTAKNEQTWHVTDLKCMISGYTTVLKVSADITFDGTNYVVSNVDAFIATEDNIDSGNTENVSIEHLEPGKNAPYLTVDPDLVKNDREPSAERERNNRTMPTEERKDWISGQFHWWSGAHTGLEELVKDALNDEKSYDHKESKYIDIVDETKQNLVNDTLKQLGSSQRVEIGDLFIILEFSAKNVFNATIKSTAYGIVRYSDNTVVLISVE